MIEAFEGLQVSKPSPSIKNIAALGAKFSKISLILKEKDDAEKARRASCKEIEDLKKKIAVMEDKCKLSDEKVIKEKETYERKLAEIRRTLIPITKRNIELRKEALALEEKNIEMAKVAALTDFSQCQLEVAYSFESEYPGIGKRLGEFKLNTHGGYYSYFLKPSTVIDKGASCLVPSFNHPRLEQHKVDLSIMPLRLHKEHDRLVELYQ